MSAIIFPTSSAPGARTQEGAGRIVNGYAVKTEQGARGPIRWKRTAGLREKLSVATYTHTRGFELVNSTVLHVVSQRVSAVTEAAGVLSYTDLGELTGTLPVTIAQNNAAVPNIVAVTEDGTFNLFVDSAPTSFADGDLPSVNSVCGHNGYFIFTTGSGEIWASDLNSVAVQSDAFTQAQQRAAGLLRGISFRGEVLAMGEGGIEVYEEVGTTPFPLQYKRIFIPFGLIGTHAVTGHENGGPGELVWVASDYTVRQLNGYTAPVISNEDVGRAIAGSSDPSLIEGSCHTDGKNAFVVFTMPGEWTWEYNLSTGSWNEKQSYERDDWRARRSIHAFDMWLVGDDLTGKIAAVDTTYKREYNDPLIWTLRSGSNSQFPARIVIPRVDFDFTAALGNAAGEDPIETDPVVMIRWSLDGGYTFGNWLSRPLGKQGQGGTLVTVNRLGMTKAKGIVFELSVSDPVDVGFFGGQMPAIGRAA
jgi:hypothetical protein